jgi:selenocysteine lyase/cysteine desulfurase
LGERGKSLGDLGEADPANRISPVSFVFGYEVPKTCVRRVEKKTFQSSTKCHKGQEEKVAHVTKQLNMSNND